MTKKDQVKSQILEIVNSLDIAGYLQEDIEKYLDSFHYYKLNNILKNIDFLTDYLKFLDQKNTHQINDLPGDDIPDLDAGSHDLNYYISKSGLSIVGEQKLVKKLYKNDFGLQSVMQGIKGFLLLTMDEFCNATPVRLSIDQILRNRELVNISVPLSSVSQLS